MALTPTKIVTTAQKSSRGGAAIDRIILHGAASTSTDGVVKMMVTGSRQVSSNYVIGRLGELIRVVPEDKRAWTSGSPSDGGKGAAFDRRAITYEAINSTGSKGGWLFSDATFDMLARSIADVSDRYGIPLDRKHVLTHQELWKQFKASYPTACPQSLQKRVDELLTLAKTYKSQTASVKPSKPKPARPTIADKKLIVDGLLALETIARLQTALNRAGYTDYQGRKLIVDGRLGTRSVSALQKFLNAKGARDWDGRRLVVDGIGLESNLKKRVGKYRTIWALQRYLGTQRDGWVDKKRSYAIETLQKRLNAGKFK